LLRFVRPFDYIPLSLVDTLAHIDKDVKKKILFFFSSA